MTIQEIKNRILPILKKYRVKKASLFGSVASLHPLLKDRILHEQEAVL